jgi:hypothetical protein
MRAIRKTYTAKYKNRLQVYALVDGKPVLCEFKNASRTNSLIRGSFSTNNPLLIEALEKDPGFGKKYELSYSSKDESGVVDALEVRSLEINPPVVKAEEVTKESVIIPEVKKEDSDQPIADKVTVDNVQGAKEYLRNKFPELTARQLGNRYMVLEVAKEKGIVFEGI